MEEGLIARCQPPSRHRSREARGRSGSILPLTAALSHVKQSEGEPHAFPQATAHHRHQRGPGQRAATPLAAHAAAGHFYFVAPGGAASSCATNSFTMPFNRITSALTCAASDGTTASQRDTILIASGTYAENLDLEANVNLIGTGGSPTINGEGKGSTVGNPGFAVGIYGLVITGGSSAVFGGGIDNEMGTMSLVNTLVTNNSAGFDGGIFNFQGTMTLVNTLVSNNTADFDGGVSTTSRERCTSSRAR